MFYHLKSTHDRKTVGDVIISLNEIEALRCVKVIDKNETYFALRVTMKSEDYWSCCFNTEEEVRAELLKLGVTAEIVADYHIKIEDKEQQAKKKMREILERAMS